VARRTNVVHHDGSTDFAGIVDDYVAEAHEALRNAGRNCDVLDFAKWDVSRCTGDQTGVDFQFGVRHRVANHVSFDVVVSRNQQQGES